MRGRTECMCVCVCVCVFGVVAILCVCVCVLCMSLCVWDSESGGERGEGGQGSMAYRVE